MGAPTYEPTLVPSGAENVVPTDDLLVSYVGLYVGSTGDVSVVDLNGNPSTFVGVPAGTTIKMRITAVLATGTDATDLVGFLP
jgi:hypothetical protein